MTGSVAAKGRWGFVCGLLAAIDGWVLRSGGGGSDHSELVVQSLSRLLRCRYTRAIQPDPVRRGIPERSVWNDPRGRAGGAEHNPIRRGRRARHRISALHGSRVLQPAYPQPPDRGFGRPHATTSAASRAVSTSPSRPPRMFICWAVTTVATAITQTLKVTSQAGCWSIPPIRSISWSVRSIVGKTISPPVRSICEWWCYPPRITCCWPGLAASSMVEVSYRGSPVREVPTLVSITGRGKSGSMPKGAMGALTVTARLPFISSLAGLIRFNPVVRPTCPRDDSEAHYPDPIAVETDAEKAAAYVQGNCWNLRSG